MPSIWDTAGTAIATAFQDPEQIFYAPKAGGGYGPLPVIRSVRQAPKFGDQAKAPRSIVYELALGLLPARPVNGDSFAHRGRRWQVINVADLDDVGAWELTVTDAGAAA